MDELLELLTRLLRDDHALRQETAGRKVLLCSRDVADRLKDATYDLARGRDHPDQALMALLGVEVVPTPDSAPGCWRIMLHNKCKVEGEEPPYRITHQECSILAEGRLSDPGGTVAGT